ncbi:hypothetical protein SDC9_70738 [bioreactor metagenome]|uniref:Uncharacterized protein n=1 Tax=bioreactor metagenome TaxID=1076179 RepID=A0A644Y7W1_9ZZZZ
MKIELKQKSETELLKILEKAISDVGYWYWWDMSVPDSVYLEFGGVQLYQKNEDKTKPPYSIVGLQFSGLHSLSFITKGSSKTDEKWYDLLHRDKLELPNLNADYFSFTDEVQIKNALSLAASINIIVGDNPNEASFWQGKYKFVFWAENYGCSVSAKDLKIYIHNGELKLEDIPSLYRDWWEYWRLYRNDRDTKKTMPKDYACEVTIPINNTTSR